jgi:hypothetical protein
MEQSQRSIVLVIDQLYDEGVAVQQSTLRNNCLK